MSPIGNLPGVRTKCAGPRNEMGFGNDWKKALEKVKNMYVEPGKQPQLIRDLEHEAELFVDQHDLVTIPPIAPRDMADADDVTGSSAHQSVLHWRRHHFRFLSD